MAKPQKGAADAAARLIAKYGRAAVAKAIKSSAKSSKPASKYPTSNVKVVKKTSDVKKKYYNQQSAQRLYKNTYKEAMDTYYRSTKGIDFGDDAIDYAHSDAMATLGDMTKRNFKNKVNKPAPTKSKQIRKQDYRRAQIIKKNKGK